MGVDKSRILGIFKSEAESYLNTLEQGLVRLEKESVNAPLFEELFRAAHTLKGNARMMGFTQIAEVAHRIEDVLEKIQNGTLSLKPSLADAMLEAFDGIRGAVQNGVQGKEEGLNAESVCEKIERASQTTDDSVAKQAPHPTPVNKDKALRSEPKSKTRQEDKKPTELKGPSSPSTQKELLNQEDQETIRVPLSRINNLLNLTGEIVVSKVKSSYRIGLLKKSFKQIATAEKMLFDLKTLIKNTLGVTDEVIQHQGTVLRASKEIEKASSLFSYLHKVELLFNNLHQEMAGLLDEVQSEAFYLNPVVEELQEKMKEIRMLPCSVIFEGFPRLIRDIAREQSKTIQLVIEGEKTELDKKVLEMIKGPLIHVLRNAVDHGIEEPGERARLGKPETATITLSAMQEGGKVMITVHDDGRGIDLEAVKTTALRKHLVEAEELYGMSDQEILNLIYAPGFSTSPMITDVSGRGVGLDVVKTELDRLKGSVSISSEKEKETTVRLELPLTIAILQVLLIKAGGLTWAFPISSLQESLRIAPDEISTIQNQMMIQVRNRSVPVMVLSEILGTMKEGSEIAPRDAHAAEAAKDYYVLILNSFNKQVGFIVDRVLGEDEVFIKGLGSHLGKLRGVSGAAILANGECIVILEPHSLIQESPLAHPSARARSQKAKTEKKKKRILLVEDSLTTRELEKTILENSGYEVETAIDGLNALESLSKNSFHAIVSDIKMPRMDGFELCHSVKTSEKLRDIPFIIVSSLSKEEEKRKGMKVGAQAYIVKSQFDQGHLLDTIERLT